jgi:hypothetical protein
MMGAHMLERIQIPKFGGKMKDWAHFRQSLQAMVQVGDYLKVLQIVLFKTKLPGEAVPIIVGLRHVKEA